MANAGVQARALSDSPVQSAASLELAWRVVYAAEQRKAALVDNTRPLAYRKRCNLGRDKSPGFQRDRLAVAHGIRGAPSAEVAEPSLDDGAALALRSPVGRRCLQVAPVDSTFGAGSAVASSRSATGNGMSVALKSLYPRQLLVATQQQCKEQQQVALHEQLLFQQQHHQHQLNAGPALGDAAATLHSVPVSEQMSSDCQAILSGLPPVVASDGAVTASSAKVAAEACLQSCLPDDAARCLPTAMLSQSALLDSIHRNSPGTVPSSSSARVTRKVSAAPGAMSVASSSGRGGTVAVSADPAFASTSGSSATPCDAGGQLASQRIFANEKISSLAIRRSRSLPASEEKRTSSETPQERRNGASGTAASSSGGRTSGQNGTVGHASQQPKAKRSIPAGGHKASSSASSSMPKSNGASAAGAGSVAAKKRAKALKKVMLPFWYADDDPRVGHIGDVGLEGRILPEFLPSA